MKVETSVSLSEECLRDLDEVAGEGPTNRSALIEAAIVEYVERRRRKSRGLEDRGIIAKNADTLECDVRETLEFQSRSVTSLERQSDEVAKPRS